MSYTPGPWKVEENFHWHRKINVVPGTGKDWRTIAFCSNLNEADARLIAQAPAMLEALKDVRTTLLTEAMLNPSYGWKEWVEERINPIIRAAEGGE